MMNNHWVYGVRKSGTSYYGKGVMVAKMHCGTLYGLVYRDLPMFSRIHHWDGGLIIHGNDICAFALEQALWSRRPSGTVHHSDKKFWAFIAGLQTTAYSRDYWYQQGTGDPVLDNTMAESINGFTKAEVIHRKSWKNRGGSFATACNAAITSFITRSIRGR